MNRSAITTALTITVFASLMLRPASAQIARPQLGLMLDGGGGLRPVYGIPASSTVGEAVATGVLSAGCSAQICLAKTEDRLWNWSAASGAATGVPISNPAPPGPALFAFNGASAFVYFTTAATLNQWANGSLTALPYSPTGEVMALRASGDGVDYAVRRNQATSIEHLSIVTGSVSVLAALGATGPVALATNGMVISVNGATQFVRNDGSIVALPMTDVESLMWLGDAFLQAMTPSANWVIRTNAGHEQAFLLPGVNAAAGHPVTRAPLPRLPQRGPGGVGGSITGGVGRVGSVGERVGEATR